MFVSHNITDVMIVFSTGSYYVVASYSWGARPPQKHHKDTQTNPTLSG